VIYRTTIAWALIAILSFGLSGDVQPASAWLRQLRFSPDGLYVLAESAEEITVLSVEPLAIKYRIPVAAASIPAQFTPDSKEIVFLSSMPGADRNKFQLRRDHPHVERWNVADGKRSAFSELSLEDCETVALSPRGDSVSCVTFEGALRLIEVQSGTTTFEKVNFAQDPEFFDALSPFPFDFYPSDKGAAYLDYSTDGRYLVAAPSDADGAGLGVDMRENKVIALKGGLKRLHSNGVPALAFVAPNRILLSGRHGLRDILLTTLVDFPSGRIDSKPTLPPGDRPFWPPLPIRRLTDPDFVLIHPLGRPTSCAYDFRTKQAITSERPALDVLGNFYVAEPNPGELGLFHRGKGLQTAIDLHPLVSTR
jgi:WD40 repeat protein